MKQRKIPLRKCICCTEMKNKNELIRVVHVINNENDNNKNDNNKENEFFIDFTGKKNGRGAYVCKNIKCIEKAIKSKGLERSFQCAVPSSVYDSLKAEISKYQILQNDKNDKADSN